MQFLISMKRYIKMLSEYKVFKRSFSKYGKEYEKM